MTLLLAAGGFSEIMLAVGVFVTTIVILVALILAAKQFLVPGGDVKIMINDQKEITVPKGGKLMGALADAGIFVSSLSLRTALFQNQHQLSFWLVWAWA